jgi:3-oxoacyl-(acyl-carrier-protein) synthase
MLKKLDRFSHMALLAADDAINDSRIDIESEDKERIGIIIGNALGGWAFAEEELRDLHRLGVREVSPYQATAWFPAAPQGQISINYGIKGFGKTIISDIASSHLALNYAAMVIKSGRADVVLAGGTEAPVSPYALLCCNTSGELSLTGSYKPFDRSRDGYVIGEGSAVLIVEELERAKKRGARIYAEIKGFGHTSDGISPTGHDPEGKGIARAMKSAIDGAGIKPDDIHYILPAATGGMNSDEGEAKALGNLFGERLNASVSVGVPKTLFGNLLGASGACDAAIACLAIERGLAPVTMGCSDPDAGWRWSKDFGVAVFRDIENVMINSIGRGGVNASLVLGRM